MASQLAGSKSIAISLVLLLLANLQSLAGGIPLGAGAASAQRQVGNHSNATNTSAIDQVAALLKARPRQTQAKPATTSKPPVNKPQEPINKAKLLAEASTLDRQVSSNTSPPGLAAVSKSGKENKVDKKEAARAQPGKRQADFANSNGDSPPATTTTTSRRNEDPWFLDQAPLPLQPYRFSYNIKDKNGLTEQYRQEAGDGKFTTGSYGYVLPDGIYRHVDYVADDRGFHVFLRTSEPGTANQNPADVVINANPVITAPGVSYASVRADAPGGGAGLLAPYTPASLAGLPASAWNYSTLLPASAYSPAQTPLIDLLRNSAAAANNGSSASSSSSSASLYDGTLARRPPGSIVNTPARNFTSFAYSNQPPSLTSGAWPWNGTSWPTDLSGGAYQFQSLAPRQQVSQTTSDQSLPQTTKSAGFGANSNNGWWDSRAAGLNSNQGDQQRANQATGRQQVLTSGQDIDRGGNSDLGSTNSYLESPSRPPLLPTGGYFGTSSRFASPLYSPARVGPDVLLYDRPFTVQTSAAAGGSGPLKLNYDNNHVLYADSPFLSLERAKNLAHLEQINAVARLASGQASSLPLSGGTTGYPDASLPSVTTFGNSNLSHLGDQIRLGLLGGTTGSHSSSSSLSQHQHHHQEHHSSRQLVDDLSANRVLLSKEHKSGSSSASGRELGYDSREPNRREQQQQHVDLPPLPPPPPPQFNTHLQQAQFKPMGVKGGQPGAARLLAPYVDEQAFGRPSQAGQVKGGLQQQQQISLEDDDQRRQPTFGSPISPSPPAEPHTLVDPALPATASDQDRRSTAQMGATKSTPPSRRESSSNGDEIELQQQTNAPPPPPAAGGAISRSVRMPDSDYRTSLLMNDLRSMQNSIGLPQPPRLQRSSDHHHSSSSSSLIEHPAGGHHAHSHATSGLSLADQMVAARMRRVEDLLRHAHTGTETAERPQPPPSSPPQQASAQQAVAVRASRKELDELGARQVATDQRAPPVRTNRTVGATHQRRETEAGGGLESADEDQPRRRMSTGPVLKFPANLAGKNQQESSGGGIANETTSFEAQRLSAKAARLRADKVSELEKFQQRLRTQQLHLIEQQQQPAQQVKSSDKLASIQPKQQQQQQPIRPTPSSSEANSHVKYDEPNENEIPHQHVSGTNDNQARKRDHYPRPRRQNELGETAAKEKGKVAARGESQTTTTTTSSSTTPAPQMTDFARKLQSWPSLLGQQQQQPAGRHPNELPSDLSSPSPTTGANSQRNLLNDANTTGNNRTAGPNTINLDFINSVTALSVDHLNPFAIASVNPAIQRSSNAANSERLSPHRLSLPPLGTIGGASSQEQQVAAHSAGGNNQPTSGVTATVANSAATGFVATSPTRYHNSPDLLAALDYHEKRDTSNQLKGLLGQTHGSNHQGAPSASLMGAPYMMQSPLSNHRTADSPLSSRLLIGTGSQLFEAATNSQHKSFIPVPKQLKTTTTTTSQIKVDSKPGGAPAHTTSSSQASSTVRVEPSISSVQRDGFEIRDRAIQVDNHRFFEVVSSLRNPTETGSFQAFRDPQLSISANNKR